MARSAGGWLKTQHAPRSRPWGEAKSVLSRSTLYRRGLSALFYSIFVSIRVPSHHGSAEAGRSLGPDRVHDTLRPAHIHAAGEEVESSRICPRHRVLRNCRVVCLNVTDSRSNSVFGWSFGSGSKSSQRYPYGSRRGHHHRGTAHALSALQPFSRLQQQQKQQ